MPRAEVWKKGTRSYERVKQGVKREVTVPLYVSPYAHNRNCITFHVSICKQRPQTLATKGVTGIITCEALSMRYSEHTSPVLQGLELQVNRGEFVAILGRSGSGKSTLLKLIGAMEQATSGNLIVAGHNLGELDETARTLFRRRKIGFVFQNYNLLSSLTVRDNLRLPLALNRVPDDSRVQQQLETLNLGHLGDRYPGSLSGGEQQRVALARALIHRPPVVLADEPTGNLDRSTSEEVLTLLQSLIRAHGTTVVMATHSQEAARIADSIYALDEGCLVAQHQ